ncbi:MAG: MarR family transcriptional regulator, partial [Pseudomonadota bacterium]|nr:MarR family transcriptional regulator [Pseudomonadota bacterium]
MELNPTAGIKRSNRLYARILADIDRALPRGKISPTERRILLELLSRPASTDAEIASALGLDRAQLSRSIKKLLSDGWIGFKASGSHRAQRLLNLSDEGMSMAAAMDKDVDRAIESVYLKLSSEDQNILLRAVGSEAAADPHREGGGEITF